MGVGMPLHVLELNADKYAGNEVTRQKTPHVCNWSSEFKASSVLSSSGSKRRSRGFTRGRARADLRTVVICSKELSTICDHVFPDAPRIQNVSRSIGRVLSSAAAAARMRLIERMFGPCGRGSTRDGLREKAAGNVVDVGGVLR